MTPELIPPNEAERLAALQAFLILNTAPEKGFDDITRRAAEICNTPIAGICLVDDDRVWFKSLYGIDMPPVPRQFGFCSHAILTPNSHFVVIDARSDARFANNPSVTGPPNIVFYYGVPLVCPKGNALGTLCVIDHKPRVLGKHLVDMMKALAAQTMSFIRLKQMELQ